MNKKLILLFLIILSQTSYSQITFEKGYIIKNTGEKETCLIKNVDWRDNPSKIEYKLSNNGDIKVAGIKNISEFGIDNYSKYIRVTTDIDKSTNKINRLDKDRNPHFKKETMFLKTLVEGKASLYKYTKGDLNRYFFKIDDKPIKQLVYKTFLTPKGQIGKNENYKQQLADNLKCSDITLDKIKGLEYKQKDLIKIFVLYNQCTNNKFQNFEAKTKKDLFNLNIRLGLRSSSLSIKNGISEDVNTAFNNELSIRLGAETEFILPFNKNKWGIIIEPTFQQYKSKKTINVSTVSGGKLINSINYKSVEIPVGIRYYMFLKNKTKLFVNA